jgi:predicted nuclease of predicted toxin-antitoxin system
VLIDMSLSPEWKQQLTEAAFNAVHWSEVGDGSAPDKDLLDWAAAKAFVLFTHDLDFGTLLALSKNRKPSVVQLRTQEVTPAAIGPVIISALRDLEEDLSRGALITIDPKWAKGPDSSPLGCSLSGEISTVNMAGRHSPLWFRPLR